LIKQNIFYSSSRSLSARIRLRASIIAHSLYLDYEPDYRKTVFVCGAPRSGTTWLAEVLNRSHAYRYLYEPFNCDKVPMVNHFSERQYLRPHNDDPKYLEPARSIFTGKARDAWIDQYNRPGIVRRRLIKDVRSMLMLKWIREHFPGMKIIFIIRHPCAVTVSRIKLGWRSIWRETFFNQHDLMADYLSPFAGDIAAAHGVFERHIVDWCVENFVPLDQLVKSDVFLAFYENLLADPKIGLQKLFQFLELPFDKTVLKLLTKPSVTSRSKGDNRTTPGGSSIIEGWRKHVADEELACARRWTTMFGLNEIYGDGSLANAKFAQDLLEKPSKVLTQ
jgi:Sulfotransferase family